MKQVFSREALRANRKNLRNNSTSAEAVFWSFVKCRRLHGRKFRRQQSIENYIVDFYCREEKMVVELDGAGHFDVSGQAYDEYKDARLKALGLKILRFENELIFNHVEVVLEKIVTNFLHPPLPILSNQTI